jgi:phage tail sheath protein FI
MPDYLAPGVYVEEVDLKPPSIEGVSLSAAGLVGATQRGPTVGRPVLVTSSADFRRRFGAPFPATSSVFATGELPHAVDGFFANGGSRLYVVRVAPTGTTPARIATHGGLVTRLLANVNVGDTTIKPATLRGLRPGVNITLRMVSNGVTYTSTPRAIAANGINRDTGIVTLAGGAIDITPAGPSAYLTNLTAVQTDIATIDPLTGAVSTGPRPASLTLVAADGGAWGSDLVVTAQHQPAARTALASFISGALDNNKISVASSAGFYPNAWVEIDRGSGAAKTYRKLLSVDGPVLTLAGNAIAATDVAPAPATGTTLFTVCEFSLSASYNTTTERWPGLTLEAVPGRSVQEVLQRSALIAVATGGMPAATDPMVFPSGDDGLNLAVTTPGVDAAPTASEIVGADNGPGQRSGIQALLDVDEIGLIAAPGWGDQSVQQALIDQCELLKYRVALLDPQPVGGIGPDIPTVQTQRLQFDTKYAAFYYPRIVVTTTEANRAIGSSGHVAGLVARIDQERGVFKTPANEVLLGILDVEAVINRAEHEVLNPEPYNINVIRDFRDQGRGIRVYGGRIITSLTDWKYLAVRRLMILIEKSIELGTQWAVFEPNGPLLWSRLIDSVSIFLRRLWHDGALLGLKPEQAFYVRCGTDTMSQDDIDNGRLIMEIGVAPVKPAEFVIIRISQTASGALVQEG